MNFLVPDSTHAPLSTDDYIDISHESLIRQWKKLSGWLEAEARAAQQWRRLNDRLGSGEPLSRRELATVIAWRKETNPNEAWAKRYGGNYVAVSALIRKSADARRNNRLAIAGVGVIIAGLAFYTVLRDFQTRAETTRMAILNESQRNRTITLLETMIFEVPVQVTQSTRSLPTTAARRTEDTGGGEPRDPRGDNRVQPGTDDPSATTEVQPTTDRPTGRSPQDRPNPALTTMTSVVETISLMVVETPEDSSLQRLFAVGLNKLGDIKLEVNDISGAEATYRQGLEIVRRMLTVDQDTRLWQDDLALALAGVGQVHMRRSENREARDIFLEAIAIERKLDRPYAEDRLLRNLQNHLGFLGDVHVRLNERKEARAIFEERLRIRRRRHLADREDPDLWGDVSIALDRVGSLSVTKAIPSTAASTLRRHSVLTGN